MDKGIRILFVFATVKFLLQFWLIDPVYDLHRDEYLHLDQGHHLAWGFLSVPPATALISAVIILFGNGAFWVKFFPALFGVLTMVVVWRTVRVLGGNRFGQILAATCLLFSVLLRLNQLYQPNSLDVLCWTGLAHCIICYQQTRKDRWLYAAAVTFAIGWLNKYNIVFQAAGLALGFLLTRDRQLLSDPKLYMAAALSLLIITPNLMWQYAHHFPVVHHMRELAETQLVHVNRVDFLKEQLLFFMGSWPVIVLGCYALRTYPGFEPYRLFFWAFLITIALFLWFQAKGYYAIGLYPVYVAFGAAFVGRIEKPYALSWSRVTLLVLPVLSMIPMYRVAFPNKSPEEIIAQKERYQRMGLLRWEDGKEHELPQDFADMLGWRELAAKTDSLYGSLSGTGHTLVLCDNYGQAGAINYYSKKGIRAVSFNADYLNWFDLSVRYTHLIRVKNAWERNPELAETSPFFEVGYAADSVTSRYAREHGTVLFVFKNAKIDVNARISTEINAVLNRY